MLGTTITSHLTHAMPKPLLHPQWFSGFSCNRINSPVSLYFGLHLASLFPSSVDLGIALLYGCCCYMSNARNKYVQSNNMHSPFGQRVQQEYISPTIPFYNKYCSRRRRTSKFSRLHFLSSSSRKQSHIRNDCPKHTCTSTANACQPRQFYAITSSFHCHAIDVWPVCRCWWCFFFFFVGLDIAYFVLYWVSIVQKGEQCAWILLRAYIILYFQLYEGH